MTAEMNDGVDVLDGGAHLFHLREIGADESFVRPEIGWRHDVAPERGRRNGASAGHEAPADAAARPVNSTRMSVLLSRTPVQEDFRRRLAGRQRVFPGFLDRRFGERRRKARGDLLARNNDQTVVVADQQVARRDDGATEGQSV